MGIKEKCNWDDKPLLNPVDLFCNKECERKYYARKERWVKEKRCTKCGDKYPLVEYAKQNLCIDCGSKLNLLLNLTSRSVERTKKRYEGEENNFVTMLKRQNLYHTPEQQEQLNHLLATNPNIQREDLRGILTEEQIDAVEDFGEKLKEIREKERERRFLE